MEWEKAKAEYIAGGISYRKLADKYGINRSKLQARATREKWADLKSQAQAKSDANIVDKVSKKETARLNKLNTVTDKLLDKISAIIDMVDDTQGIKHISSALKDIKDIKGFKSAADMREQEARIKKLQKEAEKEDDTVDEINITFNAGPEEWNE